ncbi:MAG: PDDEXK nuclease domain-containing protein [Lachnospiraceae bacterium]
MELYAISLLRLKKNGNGEKDKLVEILERLVEWRKEEGDTQTIGLLICKTKNNILAKYTVENSTEPIGMSGYELNALLPKDFKGTLPTIEELKQGLIEDIVN